MNEFRGYIDSLIPDSPREYLRLLDLIKKATYQLELTPIDAPVSEGRKIVDFITSNSKTISLEASTKVYDEASDWLNTTSRYDDGSVDRAMINSKFALRELQYVQNLDILEILSELRSREV